MDTDTEEKPLGDGWAPCGETAARGADGQAPSTGDGQRSTRSLLSGPPHGSVTDLKTTKVSRKYKVQTVVKEPKWTQWTVQRAEMVTRGFLTEAPQPQIPSPNTGGQSPLVTLSVSLVPYTGPDMCNTIFSFPLLDVGAEELLELELRLSLIPPHS